MQNHYHKPKRVDRQPNPGGWTVSPRNMQPRKIIDRDDLLLRLIVMIVFGGIGLGVASYVLDTAIMLWGPK